MKTALNNLMTAQQVGTNTRPIVASDTRSKVRFHLEVVSLSAEETRSQAIQEAR